MRGKTKKNFVVIIAFLFSVLVILVGGLINSFQTISSLEDQLVVGVSDWQDISVNCERFGIIHYGNETCKECVRITTISYKKSSGRYKNEWNENSSVFVNDTVNVKHC